MLESDALDSNVAQSTPSWRKYLLLSHQLNLVPGRIIIPRQPDVDGQAIVLAPEGAVVVSKFLVELHLLQPLPVHKNHAPPKQVPPQLSRSGVQVDAILHHVDHAERVVAVEFDVIQAQLINSWPRVSRGRRIELIVGRWFPASLDHP